MIKRLISDISTNKIKVSTALKMCKAILSIHVDEELEGFIKSELEGYEWNNTPNYRTLFGVPKGNYRRQFDGKVMVLPLNFSQINQETGINFNERKVVFSIVEIESLLQKSEDGSGEICLGFTPDQLKLLWDHSNAQDDNGWYLENAWWSFQVSLFQTVYSRTQDKLIDIIIRLNKAFPHLDTELKFMEDNEKQKSIHTNIHGNVIGSNLGIGENISQQDVSINYNQEIKDVIEKIVSLGFERKDTEDLEQILIEKKKTGGNIGKQLLTWVGKMTTKALEKGIEHKIPALTDALSNFF